MQVQTHGIRAAMEELEYRNSAALNEDMPGKSIAVYLPWNSMWHLSM